jgi:perosamine synthetase
MNEKILQFVPFIGREEYESIRGCFDDVWLTEGPRSRKFIEALRALIEVRHACFAPNGTLALYIGLRALGIGPGDEIIVPDFTFMGSASAVEMTGAIPVFCDIDYNTLQVEARHFERAITSRTRALMPVHIYGATCDMAPIVRLAEKHRLKIIEDAAQALGVYYNDRHAGTWGDVGCFSFFADKTVTTGEGGLVVTDDRDVYESLQYLRNQGRIDRGSFIHEKIGYNFRMTDIQAAIGLVQLEKLDQIKQLKADILAGYKIRLKGVREIRFVDIVSGSTLIPFRVVIFSENAQALISFLESKNIQCRTFFYPLHRQPAFAYLRKDERYAEAMMDEKFPDAIKAYRNGICLPSYPGLPEAHIDDVCAAIREFYGA